MRAVLVTAYGGADVLELRDVPAPRPGPGEVLVDVAVAGVNFRDLWERKDPAHGFLGAPPFVAGIEGVGRIAAVGEGVRGLTRGDRVGWWFGPGSYAEQVVVDAALVFPLRDDVDDETACAAGTQGMTAHALAFSAAPLEEGDWALVHAAAGGVGLVLTQLLALRGIRTIATTSTAEKAVLALDAGAEVVLDYAEVPARVLELTDRRGVVAVFDGVGRDTFESSLAALRVRGALVLYGAASGKIPPFDVSRLAPRSAYVTWVRLPHYTSSREELLWRSGEVQAWAADGTLKLRVDASYPLEQARAAHEHLEERRSAGKIVLTTGSGTSGTA